jgi:hypothetical protein
LANTPEGATIGGNNNQTRRFSAHLALLPYVDQAPLFNQTMTFMESNSDGNTDVPWSDTVPCVATSLPYLMCPSDSQTTVSSNLRAKTSYAFCRGDNAWDYNNAWQGNGGRGMRGFFLGVRNDGQGGGPRRFRDVVSNDGLSNTIAMGERIIAQAGAQRIQRGAMTKAVANGGRNNPAACMASVGNGGLYTDTSQLERLAGTRAFDGGPEFTQFVTVIPPNGPSCKNGGGSHDRDGCHTAGSKHVGGAQVLMGDGAVRFISENIDTGDLTQGPVTGGPSPYGVWGSLGSIAGGETIGEF